MSEPAPAIPAPVVVREARPDEWAAAGRIAVESYRAGGHLASDHGYDVVLADVADRAAPGPVLVAEAPDGALVGTATLTPPGSKHAELAVEGEMEFRYLGVEPAWWGHGVARALVDAVVAEARAAGAARLVCCVIAWNEPAHRLYRRYGFARAPQRDWVPVPEVELLAYELPL